MMFNITTYFGTFDILSKSSFFTVYSDCTYVNQKLETFRILLCLILLLTLGHLMSFQSLHFLKCIQIPTYCAYGNQILETFGILLCLILLLNF